MKLGLTRNLPKQHIFFSSVNIKRIIKYEMTSSKWNI